MRSYGLTFSGASVTTYDGPGFRLLKSPAQYRTPACSLGEHTHQVCKEILGRSDEEQGDGREDGERK